MDDAEENVREEMLFDRAALELESGRSRRGVYAMALTATDGDRDRAGARYLQLRVDQLASEFEAWETERRLEETEESRREEASADLLGTLFAIGLVILAVIAIVNWS